MTLDSRNFLIANWIAFLIKFCRFAESGPWLSPQFTPGSNARTSLVCVVPRFLTKILLISRETLVEYCPVRSPFRYSIYDVEINHGNHVHFHCKKKEEFTRDKKLERPLYSQKQPLIRRSLIRSQSTKGGGGGGNWKAKYNYRRRFFFFFFLTLCSVTNLFFFFSLATS